MTGEWVRLTLTNVGTQCGIFLAACRHLVEQQEQLKYLQLATQYKLYCIRALQNAISSEVSSLISDGTVGIGILMAYDEVRRMLRLSFQIEHADDIFKTLVVARRHLYD